LKTFETEDLEPGTVFEVPLYTEDGHRLAEPFTPLEEPQLERLSDWGLDRVCADADPLPDHVKEQYVESTRRKEHSDGSGDGSELTGDSEVQHEATEKARSISEGLKNQVNSSFQEAYERTENLIQPLSKGLVQDSSRIYKSIQPMVESIWHLPRVVLFCLTDRDLRKNQEYINLYSLKTAVYAMLLGRDMDMDRDEVQLLGASALVHDIGMLKIPQHIRKKEGELNDEEREVMESHPQRGARLLREIEQLESTVSTVVAEHHEQYDGRGYPHRMKGDNQHPHSRIVHLAMTFTAMTQPRNYRESRQPLESIQTLLTEEEERFDPDVLGAFLSTIGLYPVGTFVRLETGMHGMVVEPVPSDLHNPTVKVVVDQRGEPLDEPYLVHLSEDPDTIDRVLQPQILGYEAMSFA
jgi:HD-GYP domain-containing protein (c-di-GMP phosphodiesterase class II)